MVRRACTLKSLEELDLSDRTYSYVKDVAPEELVFLARTSPPEIKGSNVASYKELIGAIDRAGFIRHDFTPLSFALGRFYKDVYPYSSENEVGGLFDFKSNKQYEEYKNYTEEQIDTVNYTIDQILSEREAEIMRFYYGLFGDGSPMSLKEIGEYYSFTKEHARKIFNKALRKLRYGHSVPSNCW